eukprot:2683915-Pyramimonas_sp.AAC.1
MQANSWTLVITPLTSPASTCEDWPSSHCPAQQGDAYTSHSSQNSLPPNPDRPPPPPYLVQGAPGPLPELLEGVSSIVAAALLERLWRRHACQEARWRLLAER